MGHDPAELDNRLTRCERALFGDDDSSEGLSSRMHMTETTVSKIDASLNKITWMLITAVLIGLLNLVIHRPAGGAPSQSTSVITGEAGASAQAVEQKSHRLYLTTSDVASLEKISVREVQDMILSGEITPRPVKEGREYRIAADYRILPHSAVDCGNPPQ
jgi:hypothetical protein